MIEEIEEHALVFKKKLAKHQLSYLIKKANRLGLSNREISHVNQVPEDYSTDGTCHIYFTVEGFEQLKAIGG